MTSSPQQLFDAATALAEENNLREATLTLMQGFEEFDDRADVPQADSLRCPIRDSVPKLIDKATDWLNLLDNLEEDGFKPTADTPPHHLRWAMWYTLDSQAEIRRGHQGHAVNHLELTTGLFQSDSLNIQAVPLLVQVTQCHLHLGDVVAVEKALHRAQETCDEQPRECRGSVLSEIGAEIARRL